MISFDLDGTLVDYSFINSIWFEAIPKLYAHAEKISFKKALYIIRAEYDKIGEERIEWYDIAYWLKKFQLDNDPEDIFNKYRHRVRVYEEVLTVLRKYALRNDLVINSNCPRDFMKIELEESGISKYFKHIFSSISDFKVLKKTTTYYEKVCNLTGYQPQNMIHVGDNWKFDYLIPREVGIRAFYLDRSNLKIGDNIIHNLNQIEEIIPKLS